MTIMIATAYKRWLNYFLLLAVVLFISCTEQNKPATASVTEQVVPGERNDNSSFSANTTTEIGKNITSILQDKRENYWFATNGEGVYRYDGKTLIQFTTEDGLCNNYVGTIQEDPSGNIWLGTGNGVSRFDGRTFTTFPKKESLQLFDETDEEWKMLPGDLWFGAGGGAYRYDGNTFTYLRLPKADIDSEYSNSSGTENPYSGPVSSYTVYCTMKDRAGNLWFGTQTLGVCRYDGKSFTWYTEKGLSGPAVRGLFEDSNGNLWFGNNGYGLFRFDGKSLINFTEENGLENDEFLSKSQASGKPGPGTLARVWTINEDDNGYIWIGTIDAGVWRYDGKNLINYTTKEGLSSDAINTIYKDKKGELWFGTDGAGVCKFNGVSFTKFLFK